MWNVIKCLAAGVAVLIGLLCLVAGTFYAGAIIVCAQNVPAALLLLVFSWLVGILIINRGAKGLIGPRGDDKQEAGLEHLTPEELALRRYVRQARERGRDDEVITGAAVRAGWPEGMVQVAMRR